MEAVTAGERFITALIRVISSFKIIILNFELKNKFDEKNQKLQRIVFNNGVQPLLNIDFTYFT